MLEHIFGGIPSSFITLTYSEGFQPWIGSQEDGKGTLSHLDLDRFLNRFRKNNGAFRYFACGEYGEQSTMRPHYHAVLFGIPPTPQWEERVKQAWSVPLTPEETRHQYTFKYNNEWRALMGWVSMGEMNAERAAYVASYTVKKMFKPRQFACTKRKNRKNRELLDKEARHHIETPLEKADRLLDEKLDGRTPEFAKMSMKPGIGSNAVPWLADQHLTPEGSKALLDNSDVLPEFRHGGDRYPIGAYLANKVRERLGVPLLQADRLRLYGEPVAKIDYDRFKHNEFQVMHAKTLAQNTEAAQRLSTIPDTEAKIAKDFRINKKLRTYSRI